jgi:dephospho-CoA kinase
LSKRPGQFIIGLTGNIGTGKTVVRRMLEHLGAYTIDADGLSHRAIAKGAPGYEPVLLTFGRWILGADGEIDRGKLGNLVFRDPGALAQLEGIIHPLVREAVEILVSRAPQPVVVVEAIKLLESQLKQLCDSIWVTYAPPDVQIERLTRARKMSREEALVRINAQGAQTEKIAVANIVIRNTGSYDELWRHVAKAWSENVPPVSLPVEQAATKEPRTGNFSVTRGKPKDCEAIAGLINRLSKGRRKLTAEDVMAQFGEKAYMLLQLERTHVGIAGWQVENLVVRTTDLYLEPGVDLEKGLEKLICEIEHVSGELQCEASLVFPTAELAASQTVWERLGYETRRPQALGVQAWTDAARESMPVDATLLFKQLRKDRVLRPI